MGGKKCNSGDAKKNKEKRKHQKKGSERGKPTLKPSHRTMDSRGKKKVGGAHPVKENTGQKYKKRAPCVDGPVHKKPRKQEIRTGT